MRARAAFVVHVGDGPSRYWRVIPRRSRWSVRVRLVSPRMVRRFGWKVR